MIRAIQFYLLFFYCLTSKIVFGQNLVPNPSFELHIPDCITTGFPQFFPIANDWQSAIINPIFTNEVFIFYINPECPTPYDIHNQARTGKGLIRFSMATFIDSYGARGYPQVKLNTPLMKDSIYCIEFYVRLRNRIGSIRFISGLGVALTEEVLQKEATPEDYKVIEAPHILGDTTFFITDSINWTRIATTYRAGGGEEYLTIGNFLPLGETPYLRTDSIPMAEFPVEFYMDDVTLIPAPPLGYALNLGRDSTYCHEFPTQVLSAPVGFQSYRWSTGDTTTQITVTQPGRYIVTCELDCCSFSDTITLRLIHPPSNFSIGADTFLCPGDFLRLLGPPGYSYQWDWNPVWRFREIYVNEPGQYTMTFEAGCSIIQDTLNVLDYSTLPDINLGPDIQNCLNFEAIEVTLNAGEGYPNYQWSTGAATSSIVANTPGWYWCRVNSPCGGSVTDSIQLFGCQGQDNYALYIPNVFMPYNATTIQTDNGFFVVYGENIVINEVSVYNRMGNRLFQTNDATVVWDGIFRGEIVPPAVYVAKVTFTDSAGKVQTVFRDVTVIR
jgi:CHU_C Type IX secretion signal domain